jgi:hypothetical protein
MTPEHAELLARISRDPALREALSAVAPQRYADLGDDALIAAALDAADAADAAEEGESNKSLPHR